MDTAGEGKTPNRADPKNNNKKYLPTRRKEEGGKRERERELSKTNNQTNKKI